MGVPCSQSLLFFIPLFTSFFFLFVIAGELEGSWRAGGQQEGLQYNGEAAGWKVISDIFL